MTQTGNPSLIRKIREAIEKNGPLPFDRFMESALFDPEFGYYMVQSGRIGLGGDFYTSPDVSPFFGRIMARQFLQMASALPDEKEFTLLEMGAGKGLLCRDILNALKELEPESPGRIRYVILERSPAMIENQKAVLGGTDWKEKVRWISGLEEAGEGGVTGCVFSNELFDSFPVRRFAGAETGLKEFFVDWKEDRFIEVGGEPADSAPEEYFKELGIGLSNGQRAEVSFSAPEWMKSVGRILKRGFVLTVDYGYSAEELFSERLRKGTLLCYYRHTVNEDPCSRVGEQDMTAHVDFSSLARAGGAGGLEVTGFTNQLNFLMGLGITGDLEGVDPESPEMQAVKRLLARESMGGVFKVLIQHKGLSPPVLDGLAFRPFRRGALGV